MEFGRGASHSRCPEREQLFGLMEKEHGMGEVGRIGRKTFVGHVRVWAIAWSTSQVSFEGESKNIWFKKERTRLDSSHYVEFQLVGKVRERAASC